MCAACRRRLPVRAAHTAVVTLTAVQADSRCSQLNDPGVIMRSLKDVTTVAYIAAAQMLPSRRCERSPRRRRASTTAPSPMAVIAEDTCTTTSGVQT